MKRIMQLIALCLAVAALWGCSWLGDMSAPDPSPSETKRSEIVLTARQKDILLQQGLSADYESLTVSQQSAIMAIEALLCHLDQYGVEFVYDGYLFAQNGQPEKLLATTVFGGETIKVTASRSYENGQWVYEDDYCNFLAKPAYLSALMAYFDATVAPNSYKLFTQVKWVEGQYSEENVLKNVAATSVLYISQEACPDAEALANAFAQWIRSQGLETGCTLEVCVVKAEDLANVYSYNYVESITKAWVLTHIICTIDKFGGVTIA